MKKVSFSNEKFKKMLKGKGFYIALCCSLVAVIGAGFVAYNQTLDKLGEIPAVPGAESSTQSQLDFENANTPKTDIPMDIKDESSQKPVDKQPLMIMPLNGDVINPFSNGQPVKSQTTGMWTTHNGVDIKGKLDDHIKSIANGTVTEIKEDARWGYCIEIDHGNGIVAKYCNLNKTPTVKKGDSVSTGTVIGAIGNSAVVEINSPPHLHLEVTRNGDYIDPMDLIAKRK